MPLDPSQYRTQWNKVACSPHSVQLILCSDALYSPLPSRNRCQHPLPHRWDFFNLRHLKSHTKVTHTIVRDFLFADDCALAAHSDMDRGEDKRWSLKCPARFFLFMTGKSWLKAGHPGEICMERHKEVRKAVATEHWCKKAGKKEQSVRPKHSCTLPAHRPLDCKLTCTNTSTDVSSLYSKDYYYCIDKCLGTYHTWNINESITQSRNMHNGDQITWWVALYNW